MAKAQNSQGINDMPNAAPLQCHTCNSGVMSAKKIHRMSGPAVVIGYIIAIPSALGLIAGILISILSVIGAGAGVAGATASDETYRDDAYTLMAEAVVPDELARYIAYGEGERVSKFDFELTEDQSTAIRSAETQLIAHDLALGTAVAGGTIVAGLGICWGVACLMSGLLGWLLIMKKKVLQCSNCGAVVAAG